MKKAIVILSVLVLIVIFYFILGERKRESQGEAKPLERDTEEHVSLTKRERVEIKRRAQIEQREREMKIGVLKANVPIGFWGQVVDQNGKPIEEVKITYRVSKPRAMWDSNTELQTLTTDAKGFFHIKDYGSGFSFEAFEKKGYAVTKGQRVGFNYGESSERYIPDENNPKVYTLIREDEIPSLLANDSRLLLEWDGVPIYYDLKEGKLGKTGQIKITAKRGEVRGEGQQARYDWSFKIEIPNGGLIETNREKAFLAPEEGYLSVWEYGFLSSDPNWRHHKEGEVYMFLKLPEGNYGRLMIRFTAEPGSRLSGKIESYLNPSGGRLLEYDSRREIK